jgi:hypothetical protein
MIFLHYLDVCQEDRLHRVLICPLLVKCLLLLLDKEGPMMTPNPHASSALTEEYRNHLEDRTKKTLTLTDMELIVNFFARGNIFRGFKFPYLKDRDDSFWQLYSSTVISQQSC